ncbi:MAG: hypothetical protein IPN81_08490 [Nitrosomonadales bacterium]|nr:hypothetical protein [Nitrosomonadales bacterium]
MVALTHPKLTEDFEEGMKFVANKDYTKAAELFKKVAEQGHAEAQFYPRAYVRRGSRPHKR